MHQRNLNRDVFENAVFEKKNTFILFKHQCIKSIWGTQLSTLESTTAEHLKHRNVVFVCFPFWTFCINGLLFVSRPILSLPKRQASQRYTSESSGKISRWKGVLYHFCWWHSRTPLQPWEKRIASHIVAYCIDVGTTKPLRRPTATTNTDLTVFVLVTSNAKMSHCIFLWAPCSTQLNRCLCVMLRFITEAFCKYKYCWQSIWIGLLSIWCREKNDSLHSLIL